MDPLARERLFGLLEAAEASSPVDSVEAVVGGLGAALRAAVLNEERRTAHALAFVVITNRRHTDVFEWGQRNTPLDLSAEIQRRLLPTSFTCEAAAFTLAA